MQIADEIFGTLSFDEAKLLTFGFMKNDNRYCYRRLLADTQFEVVVEVEHGRVSVDVIDRDSGEAYALINVAGAEGAFIGRLRNEVETVLHEIAASCCYPEVFKSRLSKIVIAYTKDKYGDELEFLWDKFPKNAVLRRKDNAKWYAALLVVKREKLGLAGEGDIEILDLRADSLDIERLVDGKRYFSGYHMNKKHWISLNMEEEITPEEICDFVDKSYEKAGN